MGRDSTVNPTALAIVPFLIAAHTKACTPSVAVKVGDTSPIVMPVTTEQN